MKSWFSKHDTVLLKRGYHSACTFTVVLKPPIETNYEKLRPFLVILFIHERKILLHGICRNI
jgi:hypothetical protein